MPTSKTQPALLGGLLLGVLSALPFVNVGNLCCCLWILAGGALAAYLLQERQPTPISMADGAAVGLMAGGAGAVVWFVLSVPINLLMGPLFERMTSRLLEGGSLPPAVRQAFESVRHAEPTLLGSIGSFLGMLVVCSAFSTVGGIIGAALFKKSSPVTADVRPPDLPPTLP